MEADKSKIEEGNVSQKILDQMIKEGEEDISQNRLNSSDDLRKEIKTWREKN